MGELLDQFKTDLESDIGCVRKPTGCPRASTKRVSSAERPGQLAVGFGDLLDDARGARPFANTAAQH
jgi:hypothetical protein